MNCPICHEPYLHKENRGIQHGFKGATYGMEVYEHEDKECVFQKCFYPNYFGKGPKTVIHSWSSAKIPKPKEKVSFINRGEVTNLSRSISHDTFMTLLRAGAVKKEPKGWNFNKEKSKLILEKEYEVV